MERQLNVIIERDAEGFYVASSLGLRGCHAQGRSMDEVLQRIRQIASLCLEVYGEPAASEFIAVHTISLP